MITFESVKRERPDMSDENIQAFMAFARNFDCLDADNYDDARHKILLSMEDVSDELEGSADPHSVLARRYSRL